MLNFVPIGSVRTCAPRASSTHWRDRMICCSVYFSSCLVTSRLWILDTMALLFPQLSLHLLRHPLNDGEVDLQLFGNVAKKAGAPLFLLLKPSRIFAVIVASLLIIFCAVLNLLDWSTPATAGSLCVWFVADGLVFASIFTVATLFS